MRRATLLLVATITTLSAPAVRSAAAQEADTLRTAPDTLRAAPDTSPAAPDTSPAPPRPEYVPPRYAVSLMGGRSGAGTVQEQPVLAIRFDDAGMAADSSFLQRALEADGGFQVGASALVSLAPGWAVRLGAGVGRLTLRPRYEGSDSAFVAVAEPLGEAESAEVSTVFVEGALRMRLFTRRRPQPYLEVGASAVRWTADDPPAGAAELADGVARFAALAAVGVLIPFNDRVSARVQVETRGFRTPIDPSAAGSAGPAADSMTLTFVESGSDRFVDSAHELRSSTRLDVGVSFGFGAIPRRPTPAASTRPAAAAPPGSPGHGALRKELEQALDRVSTSSASATRRRPDG